MDLDDYHECSYCDDHNWQEGFLNNPRESLQEQLPDFLIKVEIRSIENPKYRLGTSVGTQYGSAMVYDAEILSAIEGGGVYLMRSGYSRDRGELVVEIVPHSED